LLFAYYWLLLGTRLAKAHAFMNLVSLAHISPQLSELQMHFPKQLPSSEVYVRGDVQALRERRGLSLAIVGTRMPSPYGYRVIDELLEAIQSAPISIVSGGAFGIDSYAHRRALQWGLPTRAWLVGPIADPGPRSQRALFDEIAASPGSGLLVPKFLEAEEGYRLKLGAKAWLARNAWIAADADVVLCVEASLKSGTWQTARDSNDLGKEIYAIPGSVFEPRSEGCNAMISRSYAKAVFSIRDFAESLVVRALQSSYNNAKAYV
jgi:DNA processing protein